MLHRLCVRGMEIGIAKHFLEKGRDNLSFKPHSGDICRWGKDKSLHASDFPGISHVPVEAEPATNECEGQIPTFLAVKARGLGRDALTKPLCLQGGEGGVRGGPSMYNQD